MKILKVKFENINNLKGENVISFEEEPLNSAGIFAITGPTGSGKSTLLDVITLALFNRIPRFKGTISKSSIEGLGSVVTHHTDRASASITYEIHDEKFTSSWTVGRTKTGRLKDYEMFIYDSEGTPLDLKKSEVPSKNEEIIGLKYDQFVKSIILSQGQFSRFLKAKESERSELLEDLTGASIYREISIAAYEKFKAVKDEVALEKDRLEHIQVLSEEERGEILVQIKSDDKTKTELDAHLEKFNAARQVKSNIEKKSASLEMKRVDEERLKQEKEAYKDKLNQLEIFDRLSPILGELTRYHDTIENQEKLTLEISGNEKLLAEAQSSRNLVIEEMSTLAQIAITAENFNDEMSKYEREVNNLIQELQHIHKSGEETRERITKKVENYQIDINPKSVPDAAISVLEGSLDSCNAMIKAAGLELEVNVETVESRKATFIEELNLLNELHQAYEKEMLAKNRMDKAGKDLLIFLDEVKKYSPLAKTASQLVATTKENIELLEKQRQDSLLIAKLTDHRSQLKDGEPCPLCGALDHPFSEHAPSADSELDISVQKAKEALQIQEVELNGYNTKLTESLASKNLIEEQIKLLEAELENAAVDKKLKYDAYQGTEAYDEKNIAESIDKVVVKINQFSKASQAIQNRSVLKELIADFEEMKEIRTRYVGLDKKLKEKYSGTDVSEDCNRLQDRFVQSNTRIATLNTVLENKRGSLIQANQYVETAIKKLNPQIKELGFGSIEETSAFMISEEEVNLLKERREELARKSTTIETEIKTLTLDIAESKKRDSLPEITLLSLNQNITEETIKREALIKSIGEKTAILQKDDQERERIKTKESDLKKLQEKLDKWSLLNKLIGEKTGNKFANFAQGITLQNLLVFANKRLQKLSDRYLLDKPIKDGTLTVIDQYQGNIQRSVATLSGGESFLISLALALSLSDMASKNVNLESLFIDEGFGTLDQESLDVAMNTLEKLQSESQKTVGVISHVEALKERIHVQIKLDKNAQGYGRIKIVG